MKRLITTGGLVFAIACQTFAGDNTALARVTAYSPSKGSAKTAASNKARLHEGDCAVDPKKIPYGSKMKIGDGECVAKDTGPGVVNRKAARSSGRNAAERNAIVIDRYFDSKERARAWAKSNPHFMPVQVQTP